MVKRKEKRANPNFFFSMDCRSGERGERGRMVKMKEKREQ